MQEIRLLFSSTIEGSYRVSLTDEHGSPVGIEVPFTPFLSDADYADLRWYLEEYMELPDGGSVVRAERIEAELTKWGRQLHRIINNRKQFQTAFRFKAVWLR